MNIEPTPDPKKPYHHGDLRAALLKAAEHVVEAEGVPGLTLRGLARAVSVSPAAPSKHFDDLQGLLSELAAAGHLRMDAEILARMEASGPTLRDRALAMGKGYVDFARRHPGLFTLMYRGERLDRNRPALKAALAKKRLLTRSLLTGSDGAELRSPTQVAAQATALWCLVHGYAVLLLDGRLDGTLDSLPDALAPDDFLTLVLQSISLSR